MMPIHPDGKWEKEELDENFPGVTAPSALGARPGLESGNLAGDTSQTFATQTSAAVWPPGIGKALGATVPGSSAGPATR